MGDRSEKGLWSNRLETAVKWIQPIFLVGGLIWTGGGLTSDVKEMKTQLESVHDSQLQQAAMTVEIKNLQGQIQESRQTQRETNSAVSKLADSVQSLSVVVARMEGKQEKRK